jgi:hypothetical protein
VQLHTEVSEVYEEIVQLKMKAEDGKETRNKLTSCWQEHGLQKGDEFALLTRRCLFDGAGDNFKLNRIITD